MRINCLRKLLGIRHEFGNILDIIEDVAEGLIILSLISIAWNTVSLILQSEEYTALIRTCITNIGVFIGSICLINFLLGNNTPWLKLKHLLRLGLSKAFQAAKLVKVKANQCLANFIYLRGKATSYFYPPAITCKYNGGWSRWNKRNSHKWKKNIKRYSQFRSSFRSELSELDRYRLQVFAQLNEDRLVCNPNYQMPFRHMNDNNNGWIGFNSGWATLRHTVNNLFDSSSNNVQGRMEDDICTGSSGVNTSRTIFSPLSLSECPVPASTSRNEPSYSYDCMCNMCTSFPEET